MASEVRQDGSGEARDEGQSVRGERSSAVRHEGRTTVEVSAGPIEYEDTGGAGPVLVLVPGLLMDARQWELVVPELRGEFRCLTLTMPMGAHRRPMKPDADLTMVGMGRILTEFLAALDLRDVVLCFNDWSGAQAMALDDGLGRVGKLALISVETVGNYPPGLAGWAAWVAGKIPGSVAMMRHVLAVRRLRRLPFLFGQMSKREIPDELMRHWLAPLARPEIRRDLAAYAGDAVPGGQRTLRAAQPRLAEFERPVLVVWDAEGKMMPNEEGRKLAAAFPDSRYVELPDCYTLVARDQPLALAAEIRRFATG